MIDNNIKPIRRLLAVFIAGLALSGLSAIPISSELHLIEQIFKGNSWVHEWILRVQSAYEMVQDEHPFLLYGYDWLAFAHFVLAILFIGAYRNPVTNIWVIEFGIIASVLIFPFAFIAGYAREIPIGWRLIDCSFGVGGLIILSACYRKTKKLINSIPSTEDAKKFNSIKM